VLEAKYTDPDQEPPRLYYPNYIKASLPWQDAWISAFRFGGDNGNLAIYLTGKGQSFVELIAALDPFKAQILSELPKGSVWGHQASGKTEAYEAIVKANAFESEDQKRAWLISMIDGFTSVFRTHIERISRTLDT